MKQKYIIVSSCSFDKKHWPKGSILELDPDDKEQIKTIALLNHAGRIGLASKENIEAIHREIKTDEANERRIAEQAAAMGTARRPALA